MTQLGKRYTCTVCGTAVLCLRPTSESVICCDVPLVELQMEELPSGD
jgi:hypothetical protein